MNVIKKIVAFFTFKGKQEQLELEAAEINREGVILHSAEDPKRSLFVNTTEVEILLNNGKELTEDDILDINDFETSHRAPQSPGDIRPIFIDSPTPTSRDLTSFANEDTPPEESQELGSNIQPRALSHFMPSKKRFTVMLYTDEYDMLMKTINDNGYEKVEYFLACMTSAKKKSLISAYNNFKTERRERHKTALSEARRAQAEDYYIRRVGADRPQA